MLVKKILSSSFFKGKLMIFPCGHESLESQIIGQLFDKNGTTRSEVSDCLGRFSGEIYRMGS